MPACRKKFEVSLSFFIILVKVVIEMPTEAKKRANKKYSEEKLEMISIRVPKGEPELFKAHAAKQGESLAAFLRRAAKETIDRDNDVNQ